MITVSVIVVASNGQKYELRQALENLNAQSCRPDEIVIVDASQSNETQSFVTDILRQDTKYLFVHKPETQYTEQELFEIGVKQSVSEYIAFLYPGDTWDKDRLLKAKEVVKTNDRFDFIMNSYTQRICIYDKIINVDDLLKKNYSPFFLYLSARSAVILKRSLFFAFEEVNAYGHEFVIAKIPEILSHIVHGARKDMLGMEQQFWRSNYSLMKKNNLLQQGAIYCIEHFQDKKPNKNSYMEFSRNVGLEADDAIDVLWEKNCFTVIEDITTVEKQKKTIEKQTETIFTKQNNYIFVRDYLEFKVNGGNTADKLKKQGITRIGIYGAGKHGVILFKDLRDTGIDVICWIDKAPKQDSLFEIPVVNSNAIGKVMNSLDAVIITPFMEYNDIAYILEKAGVSRVISIADLIK